MPIASSQVNQPQEKMTKVTNIQEPRKSCRIRKPPERFLQYQCNHTTQKVNKVTKNTQEVNKVPKTYKQAIASNEAAQWKEAMDGEI